MKDSLLEVVEDADPIRTQAATWFARLHADELSEDEQAQHHAWLDSDPAHRLAYERVERMWSMLGDFSATAEISQRLAAIPAVTTHTQPQRRPRRLYWLAACAAAMTAIVIGWRVSAPAPISEQRYASAIGEQRSITLDDGTQVDLDTGTTLRVRYSRQERRIELDKGRAFFKVAPDSARPLTVDTTQGSVRAVGTQFEVYRQDNGVDVSLFEGKVQLRAADDNATAVATLSPGQRAHLAAGQPPQVQNFQGGGAPAWVSGQLVFENLPLRAAVEEFNRYGGRPLRVNDAALGELRVSGVFRSNDSTGFLEALNALHKVSAHTNAAGETELNR